MSHHLKVESYLELADDLSQLFLLHLGLLVDLLDQVGVLVVLQPIRTLNIYFTF